jgi:hypothetical protein
VIAAVLDRLRASRRQREQRDDITVLACLMLGDQHFTEIFKRTGLGSGRVYPALARLESAGLVASAWSLKDYQDTFPPLGRRLYWPTVRASKRFEQWQEVSR